MGHVWLARDERSGLDVALKIVAREGKSGHRAEREARAAASLRHPRCQRILSLARDPSHVYIAYEYIPGRTLREAMRAGELDDRGRDRGRRADLRGARARPRQGDRPPRREAVERPARRDLTPSRRLDVRLLDFGLAQMAEFDTLTALGDIPGTLAYISPERLQGLTATSAADVWGVGVLLWEALAGEHPFWGGDMVETSRRIQHGAEPLGALRPDLPAAPARDRRERAARQPAAAPVGRAARARAALAAEAAPLQAGRLEAGRAGAVVERRRVGAAACPPRSPASPPAGSRRRFPSIRPAGRSGIAALGAALGFAAPRLGLLFALTVAFFPLANISLGPRDRLCRRRGRAGSP